MKFKLLFVILVLCSSQDMPDLEFPKQTPVIMLNDNNWDAITHLGNEGLEKPWFIFFWAPWCKGCHRIVKIWEEMVTIYNGTINIGAIDTYNQELIGDRIGVTKYPTFVFFDTDNRMYFFNESTNIGNFTQFVDEKKYLHLEPYDTPKEIDHFKKWLRRIFSLKMVPVYVVVAFIVVLTSLCIYGNKQEKKDKSEAKRVRLELYRKSLEQKEREEYLKKKRD
ncbi:unnamed protein product (macronuclear) [Paramecium tetraurelia]|uniref:Thioredoxin domain-containing protein n=1 Tax=Paramecium tetraurelia TaxID=5888 RepID=A0CHL7_PARTE|nr:uncharacterized protein GSPATT00038386001 [Paramecium tetraurelia]CAK70284.1 unnamed protein product [Paramecium tetraurelia]|eukprot:XP_001437681.1 hypothetical protein (macronuclear) [Paramecium tetraurelia strain d4-2]